MCRLRAIIRVKWYLTRIFIGHCYNSWANEYVLPVGVSVICLSKCCCDVFLLEYIKLYTAVILLFCPNSLINLILSFVNHILFTTKIKMTAKGTTVSKQKRLAPILFIYLWQDMPAFNHTMLYKRICSNQSTTNIWRFTNKRSIIFMHYFLFIYINNSNKQHTSTSIQKFRF